jgi:hypothetical protein
MTYKNKWMDGWRERERERERQRQRTRRDLKVYLIFDIQYWSVVVLGGLSALFFASVFFLFFPILCSILRNCLFYKMCPSFLPSFVPMMMILMMMAMMIR